MTVQYTHHFKTSRFSYVLVVISYNADADFFESIPTRTQALYSDPLIALGHQPVLRCQDIIPAAVVCLLPGHSVPERPGSWPTVLDRPTLRLVANPCESLSEL